ncbi:hypothetical protein HK414_23885 [Ramlibacter terrae]|uniref:PAC domain-containing protein n=1 Tax=Ramlibacter terrae TaxID=2732511 RepID=A0ABX6P718_9BURK|nr:hypothetical protein HK414_23885 [Ramlibacter terrae]
MEARLGAADGSHRWWLLRGVPVSEHGRLVKWVGTCTDVEELKAAQDEISRANSAPSSRAASCARCSTWCPQWSG